MVDINLLPQKQKRIPSGMYLYIAIGVLWLAGAVYLGTLYYNAKNEITVLTQEVTQQEKQVAAAQLKQQQAGQTVTVDSYVTLSEKLQHLFYPTTLMLDEISYNLPEHGKLAQVNYSLDGKITLGGRFEQVDDVAAYLHNLENSQHVISANVKTITASPVKWTGPVDAEGKPLSPALQILGGKLMPRYDAVFEIQAFTIDADKLQDKKANKPSVNMNNGETDGTK